MTRPEQLSHPGRVLPSPADEVGGRPAAADGAERATRRWLVLGAVALVGFAAVGTSVVASGGRDELDHAVYDAALGVRRPLLTTLARDVTVLGSVWVVVVATGVLALVLWAQTRRPVLPGLLLTGVGVTAGVVYLLKAALERQRPGTAGLIGAPSRDYSFPSGHTADGTAVWVLGAVLLTVVARPVVRRLLRTAAALLALVIGLTRVYLGYHWATDVLAGWLLATAVVALAGGVGGAAGSGRRVHDPLVA